MPDRKTGLNASIFNPISQTLIGDLMNIEFSTENRTQEGRGIADIDDWPVLVSAGSRLTATLLVPSTVGTIGLMGTALSVNPAGTVLLVTGAGSYSGTVVISEITHTINRDELQQYNITLLFRGHPTYP